MKIVVLMSTYNGEKYIREQLDSILNQTISDNMQIYIRDDGSSDETLHIIDTYMNNGTKANIVLEKEENIGVKASFFALIKNAPKADYYSFADQDDVWMPDKLEAAVKMLHKAEQDSGKEYPLLYCGDTNLVDGHLNLIRRENKNPRPSFGNALVENICTGCTAVINRALLEKVRERIPNSNNIIMHDWWFYLIAEIYGKTIYDNTPHMNYRQHGNNEWGVKTSRWAVAKHRFEQLFAERGQIYKQLDELNRCLGGNLTLDNYYKDRMKEVLETKRNFAKRIRLASNSHVYRNDRNRDIVYRISLLIGKL